MISRMEHNRWAEQATESASVRSIAKESGLPPRSVQNWIDRNRLPAEAVIAIAIAYGQHPVGALVDTGYLDPEYARAVDPATALREVSDEVIADEVLRRMKLGPSVFDQPVDELVEGRSNVVQLGQDLGAVAYEGVVDDSTAHDDHP